MTRKGEGPGRGESSAAYFKDSRSSEESKQAPAVPRSRGEKRDAARTTVEASQCQSSGATGSASQRSAATLRARAERFESEAGYEDDAILARGLQEDAKLLREIANLVERLHADSLAEIQRRDAVLDWLAENTPRALELCPYKVVRHA